MKNLNKKELTCIIKHMTMGNLIMLSDMTKNMHAITSGVDLEEVFGAWATLFSFTIAPIFEHLEKEMPGAAKPLNALKKLKEVIVEKNKKAKAYKPGKCSCFLCEQFEDSETEV